MLVQELLAIYILSQGSIRKRHLGYPTNLQVVGALKRNSIWWGQLLFSLVHPHKVKHGGDDTLPGIVTTRNNHSLLFDKSNSDLCNKRGKKVSILRCAEILQVFFLGIGIRDEPRRIGIQILVRISDGAFCHTSSQGYICNRFSSIITCISVTGKNTMGTAFQTFKWLLVLWELGYHINDSGCNWDRAPPAQKDERKCQHIFFFPVRNVNCRFNQVEMLMLRCQKSIIHDTNEKVNQIMACNRFLCCGCGLSHKLYMPALWLWVVPLIIEPLGHLSKIGLSLNWRVRDSNLICATAGQTSRS